MRKTMPRAGFLVVAAMLLAACGVPAGLPGTHQGSGSADTSQGPTTLVRFVVLTPPGAGPIDLVDSQDHKHRYASGLTAGTVTDYLRVPSIVTALDSSGKELTGMLSTIDTSTPRNTMVVGGSGSLGGPEFFRERGGRVVVDAAAIGGPLPTDKPVLVSSGTGIAQGGPKDVSLTLGEQPGKCVPGAVPDSQGQPSDHDTVGAGSIPVYFAPAPGPMELTWYAGPTCQNAETTSARTTLQNGQFAYVLPWLADSTHVRFLVLPITTDKPGTEGLVTADAGPAWAPDPCLTRCVDGSPVPTTDDQPTDTTSTDPGNG